MVDYLEQGRTINGAYYTGGYAKKITRKRQGKLTRYVLLLKDIAPAHKSQVAMTAATECRFKILPHPHILLIWLFLTFIWSQNINPIFVVHSMEARKAS